MPSPYSILIHKSVNNISYRFKTGSSSSVSFHQHSLLIQVFQSSVTNTLRSLKKKNTHISLSLSLQKLQINNVLSCTDMKWNGIFWHMCEFCRYKTNTFYTTVRLLWYYHFITMNYPGVGLMPISKLPRWRSFLHHSVSNSFGHHQCHVQQPNEFSLTHYTYFNNHRKQKSLLYCLQSAGLFSIPHAPHCHMLHFSILKCEIKYDLHILTQ